MDVVAVKFRPGLERRSYEIRIGHNLLEKVGEMIDVGRYSHVAVLTDETVSKCWLDTFKRGLPLPCPDIVIPCGEGRKDVETLGYVWQRLQSLGFDRKSLLFNLGGGVVGDLGGFAASSFMRGISFVQVPTTLLSQVDASVGGKVAVNHCGVKNLVGVFAQPDLVIADLAVLQTLPQREFTAGLAEAIKHGVIADRRYFDFLSGKVGKKFTAEDLLYVVKRSCEIKAGIVETDEDERGVRKILNFGHTAGHAFESLSQRAFSGQAGALLHGEAVALGMLVAGEISVSMGLLSSHGADEIRTALAAAGLPVTIEISCSLSGILEQIRFDKKNVSGRINWTLIKAIGEPVFDVPVEEALVVRALDAVLSQHG